MRSDANQLTDRSINQSIRSQADNQPVNQSINQASRKKEINQSVNRSSSTRAVVYCSHQLYSQSIDSPPYEASLYFRCWVDGRIYGVALHLLHFARPKTAKHLGLYPLGDDDSTLHHFGFDHGAISLIKEQLSLSLVQVSDVNHTMWCIFLW